MRFTIIFLTVSLLMVSCVWNEPADDLFYLPLNDTQYPFAEIPRIVIETENFRQIRDRETKIPAKLQIYGATSAESDVLSLTVKGRGNSSFTMAKYGIKLEFDQKQNMLGFPKNKDWILVPNMQDKSMVRNYITYQLAAALNDDYAPRCHFVELFFNREYMGLYLLVESIKVGKNRINIKQDSSSFLIEKTREPNSEDPYFTSSLSNIFRIRYPKIINDNIINGIKSSVDSLEVILRDSTTNLSLYIDVADFARYYMIQEFSKNIDGAFGRSIFITKEQDDIFKMGPVWDFDIAYGIGSTSKTSPNDWYVRNQGWYKLLYKNKLFRQEVNQFWKQNKESFLTLGDSAIAIGSKIYKAAKNDEKRWPILGVDDDWPFVDQYSNYEESLDSLKEWIQKRYEWVDAHLK